LSCAPLHDAFEALGTTELAGVVVEVNLFIKMQNKP
jgi:hypothetical protein